MTFIDFLLHVFEENREQDAIVWRDQAYPYRWLLERLPMWQQFLAANAVQAGTVIVLEGDFSPNAVALFLALLETGSIIVPLINLPEAKRQELLAIAQGERTIRVDRDDSVKTTPLSGPADHPLYATLRRRGHPGLVLFSSGSTGLSKGIVHDFCGLLEKFRKRRHNLRTLSFLLFDHIGGIDTLFYSLSNGSCLITVEDRSPDAVCRAVERHRVEVLPVTPTFLNLLILSEAYRRYNLSSLKYITYGTEVVPEVTLKRCSELFPNVILLQKYGTTEVGTLRSKSRSSDSVWVKVGGEGYETRVVDGTLHIRARSAMLGYLNAPTPFGEDGWLNTGDAVDVNGDYVRFLGRKSEIINVGGEKVYPAEVESVLQEMDNVAETVVYGEKNPIAGNIVCATVRLQNPESLSEFKKRMRLFCQSKLAPFKIPMRIVLTTEQQFSARFKKKRLQK